MKNIKFIINNAKNVTIEGEEFEFIDSVCSYHTGFHRIHILCRGKSKRVHNCINVIDIGIKCGEYLSGNENIVKIKSLTTKEEVLDFINSRLNVDIQDIAARVYKENAKQLIENMKENTVCVSYAECSYQGELKVSLGLDVSNLKEDLTDQLESIS